MELVPVEEINQKLKDKYGLFDSQIPNWRVIFSHDEWEHRRTSYSREGFEVPSHIAYLPKYRQWADNKYILERALPIPENVTTDLVDKFSYEPVWVFQDATGNPLIPRWDVCVIIIDTVYDNAARRVGVKYKPEFELADTLDARSEQIDKLAKELFGDETPIGDALAQDSAVGYGIRNRNDSKFVKMKE